MFRIRFNSEQIYETSAPGKGAIFPEGFVLDVRDVGHALRRFDVTENFARSFLHRWVQRGKADYVKNDIEASDPEMIVWNNAAAAPPAPDDDELDSSDDTAADGLDKLIRVELDALAVERNVDISAARNKADVIAALRASAAPSE